MEFKQLVMLLASIIAIIIILYVILTAMGTIEMPRL